MIDAYMFVDGMPGDCTIPAHKNACILLSHTLEIAQTGSPVPGGGAGRPVFSAFRVVRKTDTTSPQLALACAQGTRIKSVTIELWRLGSMGDERKYAVYKLLDCMVSSWHQDSSQKATGSPADQFDIEEIAFGFGRIEFSVEGSGVTMRWDLGKNQSYTPSPDPVRPVP